MTERLSTAHRSPGSGFLTLAVKMLAGAVVLTEVIVRGGGLLCALRQLLVRQLLVEFGACRHEYQVVLFIGSRLFLCGWEEEKRCKLFLVIVLVMGARNIQLGEIINQSL